MRFTTIMRPTEPKASTTVCTSLDNPPPLRPCYVNSEFLASSGLGHFDAIGVVVSSKELGDGALALQPLPFSDTTPNTVRYELKIVANGRARTAPTTSAQPLTWAYIEKWALPDDFIAAKKPIYIGLFGVVSGAKAIKAAAVAVHEVARVDALAGFDDFLGDAVRAVKGGQLTSRRVWRVWAELWDADPKERVIGGVNFDDVAARISAVLGVNAAKAPTRVDSRSQRYWPGYDI